MSMQGSGRSVEGIVAGGKPAAATTRDFVDYHTGVRHTVSKSKQRLARCRFVMMYSDPWQAPLPSKGLQLARIPGLDQPHQPVYGLTQESWAAEVTCHQCNKLILNHDRVGGPARLREARLRRAARSGDRPSRLLLCGACDPDIAAPLSSSRTSQCGKRRREVLLEPDKLTVSVARRSLPNATSWGANSHPCYTVSNLNTGGAKLPVAAARSAEVRSGFGVNYASDTSAAAAAGRASNVAGTGVGTPTSSADRHCPFCKTQRGGKLGSYWRKYGYQGPVYCTHCSCLFRSHILRCEVQQTTCSQEQPCSICKQILQWIADPLDETPAKADATTSTTSPTHRTRVVTCPICSKLQPVGQTLNYRWQKYGYGGPAYCFPCASRFRTHIVRTRSHQGPRRTRCSRDVPCRNCNKILEQFSGERSQIFAAMDAQSANSCSPALISDAPRETTPDAAMPSDKPSKPAAEEAASAAWNNTSAENVSEFEWDSSSSCSASAASATSSSSCWSTMSETSSDSELCWDTSSASSEIATSPDSEPFWDGSSSDSSSEWTEAADVVNSSPLRPAPSALLGSSGVAPLAMNLEPDQRWLRPQAAAEFEDEEWVAVTSSTPNALDPLSESSAWQKPSTAGGRGYIRTAKRLVARGLPVVVVVSLALNVLITLRNQAYQQHGSLADDISKPAISMQCGRSMEEYMLDIDLACCGDVLDDHPDSRCSVGSWITGTGKSTQVWRENNLFVCTDSCAERVLPLWSQCIQPELLDKYGASGESPAWLFKPVVAKCSQPAERRRTCKDDDSVVDPRLHTLTELNATIRRKQEGEMPHESRSLCAELRAGQLECADLLTPDGLRAAEYPAGWYDDTCCRSCPVYWPRAILPDLDLSSGSGAHSSIWHDLLKSKSTFQALVKALEEQEQASASVVASFAAQ